MKPVLSFMQNMVYIVREISVNFRANFTRFVLIVSEKKNVDRPNENQSIKFVHSFAISRVHDS
jgi:hypothetical protein